MKKAFFTTVLLAFGAAQLFAADISGNWSLKSQVAGREGTLQLALRQNGNSVTGKVSGPRREYSIQKGSVDDTGHIDMQLGGGKGPLAGARLTGTLEGDRLRLTIQTKRGGQGEGIATRSQ